MFFDTLGLIYLICCFIFISLEVFVCPSHTSSPKFRPVRDKDGNTQRDIYGNLKCEIYKYE